MTEFSIPKYPGFEQIAQVWKLYADTISNMLHVKAASGISYRLLKSKSESEIKFQIVLDYWLTTEIQTRKNYPLSQYTSHSLLNAIRLLRKDKECCIQFDTNSIEPGVTHVSFSIKKDEHVVQSGVCKFSEFQKYEFLNSGNLILEPGALDVRPKTRRKPTLLGVI